MKVAVKTLTGVTYDFSDLTESSTINDLKDLVANKAGIQKEQIRLIYSGKILTEDSKTISDYNVVDNSVIHLVLRLSGSATLTTKTEEQKPQNPLLKKPYGPKINGYLTYSSFKYLLSLRTQTADKEDKYLEILYDLYVTIAMYVKEATKDLIDTTDLENSYKNMYISIINAYPKSLKKQEDKEEEKTQNETKQKSDIIPTCGWNLGANKVTDNEEEEEEEEEEIEVENNENNSTEIESEVKKEVNIEIDNNESEEAEEKKEEVDPLLIDCNYNTVSLLYIFTLFLKSDNQTTIENYLKNILINAIGIQNCGFMLPYIFSAYVYKENSTSTYKLAFEFEKLKNIYNIGYVDINDTADNIDFIEEYEPKLITPIENFKELAQLKFDTATELLQDDFLRQYVLSQIEEDMVRHNFNYMSNEDIKKNIQNWDQCVNIYDENTSREPIKLPKNVPVLFSMPTLNDDIKAKINIIKSDIDPIDEMTGKKLQRFDLPIVNKEIFKRNWNYLTNGILDGLDWNNTIAAGGAVLSCLLPGFSLKDYSKIERDNFIEKLRKINFSGEIDKEILYSYKNLPDEIFFEHPVLAGLNGFNKSDIDLFVYGVETQEEARKKLEEIVETIKQNNDGYDVCMRSDNALTIFGSGFHRDVQIVFRKYRKPCEVILGFDLDCVGVAYDGLNCYATKRAMLSIKARCNVINTTRRSTTYGARLLKYAKRGFAVVIPGYSRTFGIPLKIPSQIALNTTIVPDSKDSINNILSIRQPYYTYDYLENQYIEEEFQVNKTRNCGDLAMLFIEEHNAYLKANSENWDIVQFTELRINKKQNYLRPILGDDEYINLIKNKTTNSEKRNYWGRKEINSVQLTNLAYTILGGINRLKSIIVALEKAVAEYSQTIDIQLKEEERSKLIVEYRTATINTLFKTPMPQTLKDISDVSNFMLENVRNREFSKYENLTKILKPYCRYNSEMSISGENIGFDTAEGCLDVTPDEVFRKRKENRLLDPLSVVFTMQHDYALPSSDGFHTVRALDWSKYNPRKLGNIYIGIAVFCMGKEEANAYKTAFTVKNVKVIAPQIIFLEENPGRQGLMTASFKPVDSPGFYGDRRLFIGPDCYDFSIAVRDKLYNNIKIKITTEFEKNYDNTTAAIFRLFTLSHFSSPPAYLGDIFIPSNEEYQTEKNYELAKMKFKFLISSKRNLSILRALDVSREVLNAARAAHDATEKGYTRLQYFMNKNSVSSIESMKPIQTGARRIQTWPEYTPNQIKNDIELLKQINKPEFKTLIDLGERSVSILRSGDERLQKLKKWKIIREEANHDYAKVHQILNRTQRCLMNGESIEDVYKLFDDDFSQLLLKNVKIGHPWASDGTLHKIWSLLMQSHVQTRVDYAKIIALDSKDVFNKLSVFTLDESQRKELISHQNDVLFKLKTADQFLCKIKANFGNTMFSTATSPDLDDILAVHSLGMSPVTKMNEVGRNLLTKKVVGGSGNTVASSPLRFIGYISLLPRYAEIKKEVENSRKNESENENVEELNTKENKQTGPELIWSQDDAIDAVKKAISLVLSPRTREVSNNVFYILPDFSYIIYVIDIEARSLEDSCVDMCSADEPLEIMHDSIIALDNYYKNNNVTKNIISDNAENVYISTKTSDLVIFNVNGINDGLFTKERVVEENKKENDIANIISTVYKYSKEVLTSSHPLKTILSTKSKIVEALKSRSLLKEINRYIENVYERVMIPRRDIIRSVIQSIKKGSSSVSSAYVNVELPLKPSESLPKGNIAYIHYCSALLKRFVNPWKSAQEMRGTAIVFRGVALAVQRNTVNRENLNQQRRNLNSKEYSELLQDALECSGLLNDGMFKIGSLTDNEIEIYLRLGRLIAYMFVNRTPLPFLSLAAPIWRSLINGPDYIYYTIGEIIFDYGSITSNKKLTEIFDIISGKINTHTFTCSITGMEYKYTSKNCNNEITNQLAIEIKDPFTYISLLAKEELVSKQKGAIAALCAGFSELDIQKLVYNAIGVNLISVLNPIQLRSLIIGNNENDGLIKSMFISKFNFDFIMQNDYKLFIQNTLWNWLMNENVTEEEIKEIMAAILSSRQGAVVFLVDYISNRKENIEIDTSKVSISCSAQNEKDTIIVIPEELLIKNSEDALVNAIKNNF